MATLAYPANLQTAQTGNADSTNVIQRREETERQMVLRIVSTIGATPTVTVNIPSTTSRMSHWPQRVGRTPRRRW